MANRRPDSDAKSKFSAFLNTDVAQGTQTATTTGIESAVLMSIEQRHRLAKVLAS